MRTPPCRRLDVIDGVPVCVHGPMKPNGSHWRCAAATSRAKRRYATSEKGVACRLRYQQTDRYRDATHRYITSPQGQLTRQLWAMSAPRISF